MGDALAASGAQVCTGLGECAPLQIGTPVQPLKDREITTVCGSKGCVSGYRGALTPEDIGRLAGGGAPPTTTTTAPPFTAAPWRPIGSDSLTLEYKPFTLPPTDAALQIDGTVKMQCNAQSVQLTGCDLQRLLAQKEDPLMSFFYVFGVICFVAILLAAIVIPVVGVTKFLVKLHRRIEKVGQRLNIDFTQDDETK